MPRPAASCRSCGPIRASGLNASWVQEATAAIAWPDSVLLLGVGAMTAGSARLTQAWRRKGDEPDQMLGDEERGDSSVVAWCRNSATSRSHSVLQAIAPQLLEDWFNSRGDDSLCITLVRAS